ncbi:MAG: hypothetical protein ACRDMJ_09940 [Solirubrobacteraceae bacterium]
MLTDDQIIDEIRDALLAETDGIAPRPDLLDRVHHELAADRPHRWALGRLRLHGADVLAVLGVGLALAVAVLALTLLHHSASPSPPAPATGPPAVGTVVIAARASDPHGGLRWALRIQTGRHQACLQIGRLRSGAIGALGQDGAFGDDGRFHPIPIHENSPCAGTDAHDHLFLNVFSQDVPASAVLGSTNGCRATPLPASALARLPKAARRRLERVPTCPAGDLRNIAYGALGPDAISVSYALNGHTITEPTGPDGAYVAVVPSTKTSCAELSHGARSCDAGGGEMTSGTLQAGVITAVRYRNGRVCRLATPGAPAGATPSQVVTAPGVGTVPGVVTAPYTGTPPGAVASSCPALGYTPVPFHEPRPTPAQATSPMSVRTLTAKRYCYKVQRFGSFQIPCDHGTPPGYKPDTPGAAPRIALVDISFTARVAADNHHSVYEFSYGRVSGPASCTLNTGGTSGTTMVPIRAGRRITIQDTNEVCPGTYAGLVTYQPDGGPGQDTLDFSASVHDHSILVCRFSYVLHR